MEDHPFVSATDTQRDLAATHSDSPRRMIDHEDAASYLDLTAES